MNVEDLMSTDVLTVDEEMPVGRLLDLITAAHVKAAPVVDSDGRLVGIVSQEDILVGGLGFGGGESAGNLTVSDIMTSPAMSVTADATIEAVGRMMWRFRIHHVPIVDAEGGVVGLASSLDFCRHIAGIPRSDASGDDDSGDDDS